MLNLLGGGLAWRHPARARDHQRRQHGTKSRNFALLRSRLSTNGKSRTIVRFEGLELATVINDNLLGGLAALRSKRFNLLDNIKSLNNAAKNHVLTIEPRLSFC